MSSDLPLLPFSRNEGLDPKDERDQDGHHSSPQEQIQRDTSIPGLETKRDSRGLQAHPPRVGEDDPQRSGQPGNKSRPEAKESSHPVHEDELEAFS